MQWRYVANQLCWQQCGIIVANGVNGVAWPGGCMAQLNISAQWPQWLSWLMAAIRSAVACVNGSAASLAAVIAIWLAICVQALWCLVHRGPAAHQWRHNGWRRKLKLASEYGLGYTHGCWQCNQLNQLSAGWRVAKSAVMAAGQLKLHAENQMAPAMARSAQ